jgi:lipopolysaccharide export system protein LptA
VKRLIAIAGVFAATLSLALAQNNPITGGTPAPLPGMNGSGCLVSGATGAVYNTGSGACGTITGTNGQLAVFQTGGHPLAKTVSGDAALSAGGALTLASTITAGGPVGSASVVPIITWDAKGRLTAVSSVTTSYLQNPFAGISPALWATDATSGFGFDAGGLPQMVDGTNGTVAALSASTDEFDQIPGLLITKQFGGALALSVPIGQAGQPVFDINSWGAGGSTPGVINFISYNGVNGASTTAVAGDTLGEIDFNGGNGSGATLGAVIKSFAATGWPANASLHIQSRNPSGSQDRLVIDGSGNTNIENGSLILNGASSGRVTLAVPAAAGANMITLPAGTTDFSATGGTSRVVQQTTAGGAFAVAQLASADLSDAANIDLLNAAQTITGAKIFRQVSGSTRVVSSGAADTLLATDCGKQVYYNNAAYTVTIPAAIVPASGTVCRIDVITATANKVSVNGSAVSAATLISADSYTGTQALAGSGISLSLTTIGVATDAFLFGHGS